MGSSPTTGIWRVRWVFSGLRRLDAAEAGVLEAGVGGGFAADAGLVADAVFVGAKEGAAAGDLFRDTGFFGVEAGVGALWIFAR